MQIIIPGITSLTQYLNTLIGAMGVFRPERCVHCTLLAPRRHGHYDRKPDRENSDSNSLNPIPIFRFYCAGCKHTFSILPECIPPHRWYLWSVQQMLLMNVLLGNTLHAIAAQMRPSRSTCRRWWNQLKDRFLQQRDALCAQCVDLGRSIDFHDFWNTCFTQMSLDHAMLLCHLQGVEIP